MQKRVHQVLGCLVFVLTTSLSVRGVASDSAKSADPPPRQDLVEVNASVGVKTMVGLGMWGYLPLPMSVVLNTDLFRYLRIHGEFTYHLGDGVLRGSTGVGPVFTPLGKNAVTKPLGFQLKVPVLFEIGLLKGDTEAGDGYTDYNDWLLLGPSTGLDMTWWFRGKAGFRISFNLGYMFRVDLGSQYADDYSVTHDKIGIFESALLLGLVF